MKSLKTFITALLLMGAVLLLDSCQKEQPGSQPQNGSPSVARASGVIDDNPQFVSKVPFIISSDLLHKASSGLTKVSGSTNENLSLLERAHRPKPIIGGGGTTGGSTGGTTVDTTGAATGGTTVDTTGVVTGGTTGGTTVDATPPSVSILSPTQGQTIDPSTISVSVDASDDVGVTSVSLSVNGSVQGTLTSAPYNFDWDASPYTGTTPTLTATATDAAGNSNSFTITVAINAVVVVLPQPPASSVPSSFELVTPPVGNQGNEWVCVPFATAYAARSIEQYYRTGASTYSYMSNIFSPEYVYDQTKFSDCGSGTAITTTLDLMKNKGVCLWGTLPYDDMNGCDASIAAPYDGEAAAYQISSYGKLVNNDVTGIKTMLLNNHPVIASLALDNSFLNAGPGFVWSTYSGSGGAGHTLVIIGYDDSKQAYKVMSSWGTGWGDAGYSWISYDFFPTRAGYYVYVMNY